MFGRGCWEYNSDSLRCAVVVQEVAFVVGLRALRLPEVVVDCESGWAVTEADLVVDYDKDDADRADERGQ